MRRRRKHHLLVGVAAATASLSLLPAFASAAPGVQPDWSVGGQVLGDPPESILTDFDDCPTPEEFPALNAAGEVVPEGSQDAVRRALPTHCLKITAYNGQIKLGKVEADVNPIEIILGVSAGLAGSHIVPASGGDSDGATAVPVPGGILGIPALDPLFDLTLGLLSVSATPTVGSPAPGNSLKPYDPACASDECTNVDPAQRFGFWALFGSPGSAPVELSIPLSVKLNNTLFGPNCKIPEFDINLTTGTTEPPAGVEPLTGDPDGSLVSSSYLRPEDEADNNTGEAVQVQSRIGARFVDNTFAVPGAESCDLLLGGLLKQKKGVFDGLINSQVGLPSPAGVNSASFDIDVLTADYATMYDLHTTPRVCDAFCQSFGFPSRPRLDFGDVPVGESRTLTATVQNQGLRPLAPRPYQQIRVIDAHSSQFAIVGDTCSDGVPVGESCTIDLQFTPTSLGTKGNGNNSLVTLPLAAGFVGGQGNAGIGATGRGV